MLKLDNLSTKQICFLRNKLVSINSNLIRKDIVLTKKEVESIDVAIEFYDDYLDKRREKAFKYFDKLIKKSKK